MWTLLWQRLHFHACRAEASCLLVAASTGICRMLPALSSPVVLRFIFLSAPIAVVDCQHELLGGQAVVRLDERA